MEHHREIVAACYMLGSVCFFVGTLLNYLWSR